MPHDTLNEDIDLVVERYVHRLSHAEARQDALSDRALVALASSAKSHLYQGTQFIQIGRYDTAIHHLSQAAGLMPDDLFAHAALAEAYLKRYEQSFKRRDRLEANRIAAICQTLDPRHGHAYSVLQRIDRLQRERTALVRARITLASGILGLFLAVSVIF
jgi:tetratricopeptide (TPR) repeat protein